MRSLRRHNNACAAQAAHLFRKGDHTRNDNIEIGIYRGKAMSNILPVPRLRIVPRRADQQNHLRAILLGTQ